MRSKLLVLFVLVATLLATGVAFAGAPVHHVSGGGATYFEGLGTEFYGFNAKIDADGDVTGQAEFHFISPPVKFHAEMNCLAVDGNTAWLGMVITRTNLPEIFPVGTPWTWQVQDNGEGNNAPPDLQSYFFPNEFSPFEDCNDKPDLFSIGVFEWTNGNIQVHP